MAPGFQPIFLWAILSVAAGIAMASRALGEELPVVFHDDFERDEPAGWDFTDRAAWRIARVEPAKNRVLELSSQQL